MKSEYQVLLIDDNPINATVLEGFLMGLPVSVTIARNGLEGLSLAREMIPDVILLDVLMPGLDGFEVCEQIRFDERTRSIPVIFVTSSEGVKERILKTQTPPDAILMKPIDKTDLHLLMRSFLRLTDSRRETQLELERLKKYSRKLEKTAAAGIADINRSEQLSFLMLAQLADARDKDTGEHLKRFPAYCRVLAENLRQQRPDLQQFLTDSYVETLILAAALHDIGKVGISDHILNKPGFYTEEEREVMKQHVTIGGNLLDMAMDLYGEKPFLEMGRDIALYHHEKYDGTGYASGLSGEKIPLAARIVALVDVYDAMRSKRVYKDAMSHEEVRDCIVENKGKHFDPDLVEVFLRIQDKIQQIHAKSADSFLGNSECTNR